MKFLFLLPLVFAANLALGAERAALVIGNSAYPGDPERRPQAGEKKAQFIRLDGVEKDRALMASTLRALGFEVVEKANLRTKEMQSEVSAFATKYRGTREVLFYFSGHGAQVEGDNYLAGIDTDPDLAAAALALEARFSGEELDHERTGLERKIAETRSMPLRQVLANLQLMTPDEAPPAERDRHVRIVILDACRSPFSELPAKTRGKGVLFAKGGLASPPGRAGMFIGFAAGPGEESLALPGAPSVFTREFAARIAQPGKIQDVFLDTRNAVSQASTALGFPMRPAYTDELNPGSAFFFKPGTPEPAKLEPAKLGLSGSPATVDGVTKYAERSDFDAATTNRSIIDFEGIAPPGGTVLYKTPKGVTLQGVKFVGTDSRAIVGSQLYAESKGVRDWGTGDNLVGDRFGFFQSTGIPVGNIEAFLPAGTYAVGTDFMLALGNGTKPSLPVLFNVVTGGKEYKFEFESRVNGPAFAGFVSQKPITSVKFRTLGVYGDNSAYGALDNFTIASPSRGKSR